MPAIERKIGMVKVKPSARAVSQVIAALKSSTNAAGPTMTEILKFISVALLKPATKRQVRTALKRGVEFGILKHKKGHYLISSPEDSLDNISPTVLTKKFARTRAKQPKLLDKVKKRGRYDKIRCKGQMELRQPLEFRNIYGNPADQTSAASSVTSLCEASLEEMDVDYD